MDRWFGVSWMIILVPGTAMGVRLKQNWSKRHACDETLGCWRDERRWFKGMSHCGRIWSHLEIRNSRSVEYRPEMKWFLHVWMALSAALRLWLWGGTPWKSIEWRLNYNLMSSEHSLSSIRNLGSYPLAVSIVWVFWQAFRMVLSCLFFTGVDNMLFES